MISLQSTCGPCMQLVSRMISSFSVRFFENILPSRGCVPSINPL